MREKRAAKQDFHNDPVRRDFSADGPNKAWFADITYVRTHQGWLYLSVVMDAWSCRVVGWSMGAEDDRRAGGRRAQDGHSPQASPGGLHTPLGPRLPIRQPASGQDDEGERHQALHGAQPISSLWDNAVTESLMGPSACTPGHSTAGSRPSSPRSTTSSASTTGCVSTPPWAGSAQRSSRRPVWKKAARRRLRTYQRKQVRFIPPWTTCLQWNTSGNTLEGP